MDLIYPYRCHACFKEFDVVKSVAEMENPEKCLHCDSDNTERVFSPRIHIIGAKVQEAYFDVSLGKVIKSKADKEETLKQKGLIEVGTEKSAESFHNNTVVKKQKEREKEWSDL